MPSLRSPRFLACCLTLAGCAIGTGPAVDGSSPQVRIDAPAANATVSNQVPIDITAIDDVGIDKIRVLIDGVLLTEIFTPPFRTLWNSQSVPNNTSHVIRVEAQDLAKNLGSAQISVTVRNGVQAPPAFPQ